MERLNVEVKFATNEAGTVSGYASVFGGEPDTYGDVIAPGAYAASLAEHKAAGTRPLLLWQHDTAEPVGVWEALEEDDHGLKVSGRLVLETTRGRDTYALLKAGALNGLSIGYRVRDFERRPGGGRLLKQIDLIEISLVSVPAETRARLTSVKSDATAAMGAAPSKKDHPMTVQAKAAPEDMGEGNTVESRVGTLEDKVAGMDTRLQKVEDAVGNVAKTADRIEAKMNRPGAAETKAADGQPEVKTFTHFLRHGPESLGSEIKSLNRSTDSAGGYLAPDDYRAELDRNLVLFSPMRQIARVSTTSAGKVLLPGRTANLTAAWVGETAARSGTQPTYGQTALEVFEMAAFVDASNQIIEDSEFPLAQELARDFGEEFGRLEGAAFVNGTGSGEPEGFMTNTDISEVTAAGTTLDADDLIDALHNLPSPYAANAVWVMNRNTLGEVRKLRNSSGDYIWREALSEGNPATILGRPVVEMPDMPDVAAGATPIALGDWKSGFRVFDRVGVSILRDPYSQQASGLVRFHGRRRVAGGVTKAEAIRKLTMAAA